jgi:hypothetical protein
MQGTVRWKRGDEHLKREIHQIDLLRAMTPEQRWRVAELLYWEARAWKEAALKAFHPEWTEERVRDTVRSQFLHGKTA